MSSTQIRTEIPVALLILCLCLVACHAICPTYRSHLGFWQEGWSGQVYQDWLGRMNCSYENMTALEAVSLNGTRLAAGSPSSEYPNVSVSVEDTSASGSGEDAIDESGSGEEERPVTSHVTFMTQSVQATTELTDALISAFSGVLHVSTVIPRSWVNRRCVGIKRNLTFCLIYRIIFIWGTIQDHANSRITGRRKRQK